MTYFRQYVTSQVVYIKDQKPSLADLFALSVIQLELTRLKQHFYTYVANSFQKR